MSRIQVSDNAKEDLRNSAKYYEAKQVNLGHDFLDNVDDVLERIKENPKQFPIIYKETRKALIKRFPFQVLFVIRNIEIIVFAIFHSSQNPNKWKTRIDVIENIDKTEEEKK